jgi:2',3'-cyclic-nucleotide 2'-phosphodiesterase (5'-nucleotidase family)
MFRPLYRSMRYALILLFLAAGACVQHPRLTSVQTGSIELNSSSDTEVDSSIVRTIAPYKTALDKEMNEVLILSESVFNKGEPEGELGDLTADIILAEASKKYKVKDNIPLQFCVLNNGGLRVPLPKGEITRGKAFELMPFENEMVVLTLTGERTQQLLDFIAGKNGMPVAGLKMGIRNGKAVNVLIQGQPFDAAKNYTLVTSDYLANGGDKMDFLKDPVRYESLSYKLRDAIISYLKEEHAKGNKLNAKTDGRIYYAN